MDSAEVPRASGLELALVNVEYTAGVHEQYLLLRNETGDEPVAGSGGWFALCAWIRQGGSVVGRLGGTFTARSNGQPEGSTDHPSASSERVLGEDQTNTLMVLDESTVLKVYRRLVVGVHPEPELLTALTPSGLVPKVEGSLWYRSHDGDDTALALAMEYVRGSEGSLEGPISRLVTHLRQGGESTDAIMRATDEHAQAGHFTGMLHAELQNQFGSRPAMADETGSWHLEAYEQLAAALRLVSNEDRLELEARAPEIRSTLQAIDFGSQPIVTRIHGDLHLGQLLRCKDRLLAIDFEGDPLLEIEARRRLDTPLRDLACLLRSIDHVASAASRRVVDAERNDGLDRWLALARTRTLDSYRRSPAGGLVEVDEDLLRALELAKECGEHIYAARMIPDWSYAPRNGIRRLLGLPIDG